MSDGNDPLNGCTDRTRKTVRLSLALSLHRRHSDVEPKDLLDVIADCGSVADHALSETEYCKASLPRDLVPLDDSAVGQSAALLRMVAEAAAESRQHGDNYIGTEHILLALMRLYPTMIANTDLVRTEVFKLLNHGLIANPDDSRP